MGFSISIRITLYLFIFKLIVLIIAKKYLISTIACTILSFNSVVCAYNIQTKECSENMRTQSLEIPFRVSLIFSCLSCAILSKQQMPKGKKHILAVFYWCVSINLTRKMFTISKGWLSRIAFDVLQYRQLRPISRYLLGF